MLARTADVAVVDAACAGGRAGPERVAGWELVVVRRGVFRRETDAGVAVADATTAYVGRPGQWQEVAHVAGCGDAAVVVAVSGRWVGGDGERLPVLPTRLPPGALLAVHRLAAVSRRGAEPLAVEEAAAALLAALVAGGRPGPVAGTPHQLAAVAAVREALAADPAAPLTLRDLAGVAGYAPHHLSRVFSACTGTTITGHRRSLRARLAAARVAEGERDLAALAADLGFADHSHLVRALRAELGATPTQLRRLVAA